MGKKEDKFNDYEAFVDKFKPKLTTDDCYTPQPVYDAILSWVTGRYGIAKENVVRPFYPGGDYEHFEYSPNSVVVDNPPFSILANIVRFYIQKGQKFFLFAPHLTLFSTVREQDVSAIIANAQIKYHNGAVVNTSFITNLDNDATIHVSSKLRNAIRLSSNNETKGTPPTYEYPKEVITSTMLGKLTTRGVDFDIPKARTKFIRALDEQRKMKKAVYGGGYFIPRDIAEELSVYLADSKQKEYVFTLSENENNIVDSL